MRAFSTAAITHGNLGTWNFYRNLISVMVRRTTWLIFNLEIGGEHMARPL